MPRRPGGEAALLARLESGSRLSHSEAHRYAGFLEGECHLALVANNRTGWRCGFSVSLRDDDRQTLIDLRDALGIGQLHPKPARRGSRPQLLWALASKLECSALTQMLNDHPFRGRKLAEYEIWREGVAIWSARRYGLTPGEGLRMQRLAEQLAQARAYSEPSEASACPSMTDRYAPNYLAGFFSGEGSFGLAGRGARLVMKLRRDDRPLLDAFCRDFRLGTVVNVETPPPWSPAAVWHVTSARDVLRGIAIFEGVGLEGVGLLGRKQRQFAAWRTGAEATARARIARAPVDATAVAASRAALAAATAYLAPSEPLVPDLGYSAARTAYIGVLRTWAGSHRGLLTCTAYEAARKSHRHWPKRDTIAFAFGSWYEALRSSGLEDRAARRPAA